MLHRLINATSLRQLPMPSWSCCGNLEASTSETSQGCFSPTSIPNNQSKLYHCVESNKFYLGSWTFDCFVSPTYTLGWMATLVPRWMHSWDLVQWM